MSDDESTGPPIDVDELIAIEKEKRRIKAANIEFRKEIALKDRVAAQLKKQKREKRLAAQKKRKERENKEYEEALAKARMEESQSLTKPVQKKPAKKKKSSSLKKNNLVPPRGNKTMDSYWIDPSKSQTQTTKSQMSQQSSQSFRSPDSSSCIGSFATPPTVPKEVDATCSSTATMTRYSVISSSAASAKTCSTATTSDTSSTSGVDMSRECKGCNNQYFRCMDRRWRDICLHAVVDYFEEVDFDSVCEAGVREAYYNTFKVKIKSEIMEQSGGLYKIEDNVLIPECMVEGSLKDAIEMMGQDNDTYHYLMSKRVCDMQRHLYRLKRVWPPKLKKNEMIVNKDRGIIYHNPFDPNGGTTTSDLKDV